MDWVKGVSANFSTLKILPPSGSAAPILLCGNTNGFLSAYRNIGGTYPLLTAFSVASGRVHGVTLTPNRWVLISSQEGFSLQDPLAGAGVLWSVPEHGSEFGKTAIFLPGAGLVTAGPYSIETLWMQ